MQSPLARQRRVRRWHRAVALITSIQLLLWTISGVFFAFVDIDYVRGHQFKVDPEAVEFASSPFLVSPVVATQLTVLQRRPAEFIVGVRSANGIEWRDRTGTLVRPLSREEALDLGAARTVMSPDSAEWVDEAVVGSEYRGAPLPLWKLWESAEPSRVAYLDAVSGEVVTVRHNAWRWWDFLWSLHIMSYSDRDTLGTWLLKCFSVLAVATAALGLYLFALTSRRGGNH
ncbi:MAG: hypothetical protein VW519_03730 [Luminiphilus sp.]|jgi:uncharacterized iron-regulated membrane protein